MPTMIQRELSVADAVSEAWSELESLAEECREVVDNVSGTGLENTQRIQTLGETADTLENLSEPDVPESLRELVVKFSEPKAPRRGFSRSRRRDNATNILMAVIDRLEERSAEIQEGDEADEIETLRDECQSLIDEADGVEFPGMRG